MMGNDKSFRFDQKVSFFQKVTKVKKVKKWKSHANEKSETNSTKWKKVFGVCIFSSNPNINQYVHDRFSTECKAGGLDRKSCKMKQDETEELLAQNPNINQYVQNKRSQTFQKDEKRSQSYKNEKVCAPPQLRSSSSSSQNQRAGRPGSLAQRTFSIIICALWSR